MKFLEDCQFIFKFCGYCTYDPAESASFRWSRAMNHFITFLFVYFIGTCFIFAFDEEQPYDERMLIVLCIVAYMQEGVAHFTFTVHKSDIFEFLNHYEMIANQSKL